ncbi:hypothetical protein LG58_571 [Kosakonia radicincitans YD4]|nr:hypothetical protein LG58_571 [Kosakonia radicincitans YD4]
MPAWCKKYSGISPSELKHIRQLEGENLQLKNLVASVMSNVIKASCWFRCNNSGVQKNTMPGRYQYINR